MFETYHNNHCDSWAKRGWRSLFGNLLSIVIIFISVQLVIFSAPSAQAAPTITQTAPNTTQAVPEERILQNPPVLKPRLKSSLRSPVAPPSAPIERTPTPELPSTETEQVFDFDFQIDYTDGEIYNPTTQRNDKVHLRSYRGTDVDEHTPYVAPTIEVKPGDTVRITLDNQLDPKDSSCNVNGNTPHCFNTTNLHSHGLWVSPSGNSDNVLVDIEPQTTFQYEYDIPTDHPAGTFWYHPHRHGSTALQVSSGMVGALIVRGDRLPSQTVNGDIDTLLKRQDGTSIPERILVLQQIQYACPGPNVWDCEPGEVGKIENYNNFGPGTWQASGRYTSINGQILPTFLAKAGEIERWRMIHAGVRDTIKLELHKLQGNPTKLNRLAAADSERFINERCSDERLPYHVIADDGLTRDKAWQTPVSVLQPGYRVDALMVFPEAGQYCVIDASVPASGSVSRQDESPRLLGVVEVAPSRFAPPKVVSDLSDYLTRELIAAAKRTMPNSVQQRVIGDLKDGLKLAAFTPHPTIPQSEVQGVQEMAFFINVTSNPVKFEVSNAIGPNFNPQPYDPDRIDRKLELGKTEEWYLQSYFVSHPFHIHVNPFQIVKIIDPNGNDVSAPGAIDDAGGPDPQYPGLKGVWKDTLWVKSLIPSQYPQPPYGLYTLVVRTRYERYPGEFVLHCHILDHEDQGMMQNVSIIETEQT